MKIDLTSIGLLTLLLLCTGVAVAVLSFVEISPALRLVSALLSGLLVVIVLLRLIYYVAKHSPDKGGGKIYERKEEEEDNR